MNNHKYILEPYKGITSKHRCPNCERDKKLTRYIDTETNEYMHHTVGRCDRSDNCGFHYTPKQYFSDNKYLMGIPPRWSNYSPKAFVQPKETKPTYIPFESFKQSLNKYDANNFVKYLIELFGSDIAKYLIEKYYLGTSKHWNGANVFWQIDRNKKIRTGKIMLYNPNTGKRNKDTNPHWVHKAISPNEFNLKQCFFGEHLLNDRSKPVAIVESEKTAIISSVYFPQFIWLGAGGKEGLNIDKIKALQGRTVVLYPDLTKNDANKNCFIEWSKKADEFKQIANITVSDYLEHIATDTDKVSGLDLADYLIKFDYKEFVQTKNLSKTYVERLTKVNIEQSFVEVKQLERSHTKIVANSINEDREQDITELEHYFETAILPSVPVKLNQCTSITNSSLFIESHFAMVKTNNGNRTYLPYLNRLQQLKQILTTNFI